MKQINARELSNLKSNSPSGPAYTSLYNVQIDKWKIYYFRGNPPQIQNKSPLYPGRFYLHEDREICRSELRVKMSPGGSGGRNKRVFNYDIRFNRPNQIRPPRRLPRRETTERSVVSHTIHLGFKSNLPSIRTRSPPYCRRRLFNLAPGTFRNAPASIGLAFSRLFTDGIDDAECLQPEDRVSRSSFRVAEGTRERAFCFQACP